MRFPRIALWLLAVVALLARTEFVNGSTYYVSATGDDANPGTVDQPWKSPSKISQTRLHPGDAVYFKGGESFVGNIALLGHGSDANPVIIGSYGAGTATIDSQSATAIYGENTGGFQIQDLKLTNSGTAGYAISFFTDDPAGTKFPGITIQNVEIAGIPDDGINIGSWEASNPGWNFVSVSNAKVHEAGDGMTTYGYTVPGVKTRAIGWISVTDSEFYENNGSGLVICGAKHGLVEYCTFHDNQNTGGCWTWGTSGITIQHCISCNNKKGDASDGFGFDLDGGSQNCTIQYCLSYGNETPGYVIFDYPNSARTKNNTIRYCISENDARLDEEWGSFEIFPWGNTPIENCHIYNSVAYLTSRTGTTSASGFEGFGRESQYSYGSGRTIGCSFRNNVIYLDGPGADLRFLTLNQGATRPGQVRLQENIYYSSEGQTAILSKDTLYTDFAAWRVAHPRQEILNGLVLGAVVDPQFANVGTAHAVTDPYQLSSLAAYQPLQGSPCIDVGLSLRKLFGIHPGEFDFWGHSLPGSGPFSIGPFEPDAQTLSASVGPE